MTLRQQLDTKKGIWATPADDVVADVITPALKTCETYDCMAGFFTSGSISELSHGLAQFLSEERHIMRLLVSPIMESDDIIALKKGLALTEIEVEQWAERFFAGSVNMRETDLERHARECLAYLMAWNRLDIRIVLTKDGLFHRKNFIFQSGSDVACLTGSANLTIGGLKKNHETMQLNCNWKDDNQRSVCESVRMDFDNYWDGILDSSVTLELSAAIRLQVLNRYGPTTCPRPTSEGYQKALGNVKCIGHMDEPIVSTNFMIPDDLQWEIGKYSHQGKAVHAWEANLGRGIIALATGGGKTLTALVCAQRLYKRVGRLKIIIVVPTRPLADQWKEECYKFGVIANTATEHSSVSGQLSSLAAEMRAVDRGKKPISIGIVLNGTLMRKEFHYLVREREVPVLMIVDECHNIGSRALLESLQESTQYRLGLSATPIRQYDISGSDEIERYLGPVVFELSLKDAIGICLVPYDYYVIPAYLNDDECEEFAALSFRIKKLIGFNENSGHMSDEVKRLLIKRSRVLESARGKINAFHQCISRKRFPLKRALVFCTAKNPLQLESVNAVLSIEGIKYHQLTQRETSEKNKSSQIVEDFRNGFLDVLTSKQVLNEGANIPEVEIAYFVGSSSVRREWVQRRGRVLRLSPKTLKTSACIVDFIAIPPREFASECSAAIRNEIERCEEFALSSRNLRRGDSGRMVMQQLKSQYGL